MIMKKNVFCLTLLLSAFFCNASAQVATKGHEKMSEQHRVEVMIKIIEDKLMLDESESKKFATLYSKYLADIASFGSYPDEKLTTIAKLGVAVDKLIDEYSLNAVAVRCWDEFVTQYHIAPCLILSDLNERGIPAACELDVNNAVAMYALCLASQNPVMLLDVNNNYGCDSNKNIMFHCSAVPTSFFEDKPTVAEHLMFKKSYGEGTGVGIVNGKIKSGKVTVTTTKTEDGDIFGFTTDGRLTDDSFDAEFFGTGVVFENHNLEQIFRYMCENGYKHHVAIAQGEWSDCVKEALVKYLGYNIDVL